MAGKRGPRTPTPEGRRQTSVGGSRNPRLTGPQEAFCRCVAAGMTPEDAHIAAGYRIGPGAGDVPAHRRALSRALMLDDRIRLRIDQLHVAVQPAVIDALGASVERLVIHSEETRYWCHEQLREIARRCMAEDDFRPEAAMRAVQMVGQDVGMWAAQQTASRGRQAASSAPPLAETFAVQDALAERMERLARARDRAFQAPSTIDVTPAQPSPAPPQVALANAAE